MPKVKKEKTKENPSREGAIKKLSMEDYEKRVIELSKSGLTAEKIGEKIRQEGSHPKEYNKKISQILKEKKMYENPDLKNLGEKLVRIREHYEKNKQDKRAMREKDRVYAELRKLKQYFNVPGKN